MNNKRDTTRTDLVRWRREQEHVKRLQRASKIVARVTPSAPARPAKRNARPTRKPGRTDRRFHIALPQMSRPNMGSFGIPRLRLGWRVLSFLLTALLGTALYLAFNHPQLRVAEAQLTGNQLLSSAEINAALNISGEPAFLLTPSELENRLRLNFPELASVRVTVSLPNLVTVNVTERQPIIRWEQGGGYTWISEEGIAFRPRGELAGLISVVALSAPPVDGIASSPDPLTPAPFISTGMVQALKGLVPHVPPGTTIVYEAGNGFGWNDPRGWRVHFGTRANDVQLKMRVYETMVSSLTERGIRPALINVMYPSAPYYRMNE